MVESDIIGAGGIRRLSNIEHVLAGDIIGDSFADDPVNAWIFGSKKSITRYYTLMAKKLYLQRGFGHADSQAGGASLWLPPGIRKQISTLRSLDIAASMVLHNGIKSLSRGMTVDSALAKAKPTLPHYYLFAIGTRPQQQGQGLGGKLMRAGLAMVDEAGLPAYLESSKEQNVPFYQRFGFEVTQKLTPAEGAPPLWLMWREARKN